MTAKKKRSRKKTGSAFPSRVSQLILHTKTESDVVHSRAPLLPPAFRDIDYDDVYLYRQPPCMAFTRQVMQLRTDIAFTVESSPAQVRKISTYLEQRVQSALKTCLSRSMRSSQNEASAAERYLAGGGGLGLIKCGMHTYFSPKKELIGSFHFVGLLSTVRRHTSSIDGLVSNERSHPVDVHDASAIQIYSTCAMWHCSPSVRGIIMLFGGEQSPNYLKAKQCLHGQL